MTREEYVQLARKTRMSSLTVNTGDPHRDTLEEIYWEGYKAGYCRAIDVLQMIGPGIASSGSDSFFLHNMNKIKCRLEAVQLIEDCEKEGNTE
jgi:hypothetical protein